MDISAINSVFERVILEMRRRIEARGPLYTKQIHSPIHYVESAVRRYGVETYNHKTGRSSRREVEAYDAEDALTQVRMQLDADTTIVTKLGPIEEAQR
jgi:hypothetical protein